ncbi:hypothetical protein ACHAWO_008541 [Cyclotella atomus]|uniref:Reverse transcriptase Ty1/copia-type domain-containing protein n=1 Tax=Cyclotella atomus TaxID=382360 RepID=A0ABD3N7R6_9STRA
MVYAPEITTRLDAQDEADRLNQDYQAAIGVKEGATEAWLEIVGKDVLVPVLRDTDGIRTKGIDDYYNLSDLVTATISGANQPKATDVLSQLTAVLNKAYDFRKKLAVNFESQQAAAAKVGSYGITIGIARHKHRRQLRRGNNCNPTPPTPPNGKIHTSVRLACALRYSAGGSPYDIISTNGISHTEQFDSVWYVVDAVNKTKEFDIKYPECHEEQKKIAEDFCYLEGKPRKLKWKYRTAVGMLSYLQANTRPEISMATHQTARFCNDPKLSHEQAIMRIGRYLLGSMNRGIVYEPAPTKGLECYVNADFAGGWSNADTDDADNLLSRMEYVFYYANCPVYWVSKLCGKITLSTAESEYVALSISTVKFDCCCGSIDGILIWTLKPTLADAKAVGVDQQKFMCGQKHKFGLNCRAVCDVRGRLLDISITCSGASSRCCRL